MADQVNGKGKKPSATTIIAIVSVIVTIFLGGVTVWQTSHFYAEQSYRDDQKTILSKIDDLSNKFESLGEKVATIAQRLQDHIDAAGPTR